MGRRRRRFVDKRHSETYQLIYRSSEDAAVEEGVLVEQGQIGKAPPRRPYGPEFGWGYEEELTEEQKEEIKDLGLPSDGYNYLKHLRTLGSGRTELPIPSLEGRPSVFVRGAFVPPQPDVRILAARGLTLHVPALEEAEAEDSMHSSTVRAFSKILPDVKGSAAIDVRDVDDMIERFEGMMDEEGDLLDSFILDATQADALMHSHGQLNKRIAYPEDVDEEETSIEGENDLHYSQPKSIGRSRFSRGDMESSASFSERWKGTHPSDYEGRRERKGLLGIIDESFEAVLDQYNEEELGELDEEVENGMNLEDLSRCLGRNGETIGDGFQPEGRRNRVTSETKKQRPPKRFGSYRLMKPKSRTAALNERDPGVLEATRKLILTDSIFLRHLNGPIDCIAETGGKREEWEDIFVSIRSDGDLDCESAWSQRTRSTAHMPTLISSTKQSQIHQTSAIADPVKVSSKLGFPVDDDTSDDKLRNGQEDEESIVSSIIQTRSRDETPEEKRERKLTVKEAQREARIRKKQTKMLYRRETVRQQKQLAKLTHKHASVVEL